MIFQSFEIIILYIGSMWTINEMLFLTINIYICNSPKCINWLNPSHKFHIVRIFWIVISKCVLTCIVIFITTFCISSTIVKCVRYFYLSYKMVWYLGLSHASYEFILTVVLGSYILFISLSLKIFQIILFLLN